MSGATAPARLRLARAALLREEPGTQQPLVVLPERAVRLNAVAREILALCDGTLGAEAIAQRMQQRHPEVAGLAADVRVFLSAMQELRVVEPGADPA